MASIKRTPATSIKAKDKRALQRLRREAGFKSAKEFAAYLGIPESTYSRYEQSSDGSDTRIPMKVAWVMADIFGCSIDLVVGRADIDADEQSIQFKYAHLSKSSQERMDEYLEFLEYRDKKRGYPIPETETENEKMTRRSGNSHGSVPQLSTR